MALTPSSIRTDLKCGKGSISKGEKCHKGAATKAKNIASAVGILGGLAVNATAYGIGVNRALNGDLAGAGRALQVAGAAEAAMGLGAQGLGFKKERNRWLGSAALTAGFGTVLRESQTGGIGKALGKAKSSTLAKRVRYAPSNAVGRVRITAMRNKPMPKPKMKDGKITNPWLDSAYASGFSLDLDQLAI
jgi:hypothetical protein